MKQIKAATQKGNTLESLKKKMESKAMRVQYSASTDRQTDRHTAYWCRRHVPVAVEGHEQ